MHARKRKETTHEPNEKGNPSPRTEAEKQPLSLALSPEGERETRSASLPQNWQGDYCWTPTRKNKGSTPVPLLVV